MRKTLIAAATATVLLGSSLSPAVAATTAELPTDVQVSWADLAKGWIRVTWKDEGQANYLSYDVDGLDLPPTWWDVKQDADGNNEAILKSVFTNHDKVRVTVRNGQSETARTPSAWFDTRRPAQPKVTGATPLADQSLRLTLTQAKVIDVTPDDPLDRADETLTAVVGSDTYQLPLGSTTTTIPPHPRPWTVELNSSNEWGSEKPARGSSVSFGTMTAGLQVEPLGEFHNFVSFNVVAAGKACSACEEDAGGGVVAQLQSRISASYPWKTIGTYGGGRFTQSMLSLGGQQYRIYIPAWTEISTQRQIVTTPVATSARYSATQATFITAWFNKHSAKAGQVVRLAVWVQPEASVRADLQWWDGKVWHHGAYVPLVKGKGTLNIKASGRGTTRSWRVVVPKMSNNGKPILATASRAFKLAVS
jgi:hypothetical protein